MDLLPTLLELLGLDPTASHEVDGRSLAGLLDGAGGEPRVAYSESINDLTAYDATALQDESLYAINDGRWKLILHREGGRTKWVELFDLGEDPREVSNRAEDRPDQAARLIEHLEQLEPFAGPREIEPIDEETRDNLRALGYVN